jgi:hypothetical protein
LSKVHTSPNHIFSHLYPFLTLCSNSTNIFESFRCQQVCKKSIKVHKTFSLRWCTISSVSKFNSFLQQLYIFICFTVTEVKQPLSVKTGVPERISNFQAANKKIYPTLNMKNFCLQVKCQMYYVFG